MSTDANVEPFSVKDCALATIATGKKAQNLKEMREHLFISLPPFGPIL
jgi:hypothetical protein